MYMFKDAFNLFSWGLMYLKLNASWVNFCICPVQTHFILPRTELRIAEGGKVTHTPA